MNLSLVKKADFNGVECDFYNADDTKEVWLTREQIGTALEYEFPMHSIAKIHERNKERIGKFSVLVKLTNTDGKAYNTYLYSPKGVYEICRWSRQPKADAFMDWVWEVVESIRTGKSDIDMAAVIAETVRVTLTEFTKQIIPIFREMAAEAAAPQPSEVHIYNDREEAFIPRRKHHSIIEHLDDDIKKEVEYMICSPKYSLQDVADMLREYGVKLSIQSVHRYSKRLMKGL